MPRKVFIAYDHSKTSEHVIKWILEHDVLFPDDDIVISIVVDDEPTKMYDPMVIQAAGIHAGSEWLADDYRKRVAELERDARGTLKGAIAQIKEKGVSEPNSLGNFFYFILFYFILFLRIFNMHFCPTASSMSSPSYSKAASASRSLTTPSPITST